MAKPWAVPLLFLTTLPGALGVDFESVVIGDTRPTFESENFRNFERLIPRINALKPALVINLGFMTGRATWVFDASAFSVEPSAVSVRVPAGGAL